MSSTTSNKKFLLNYYVLGLIVIDSFYVFFLSILRTLDHKILISTYVTLPVVVIVALYLFLFIYLSGYPKSYFGLTTRCWRKSIATMNKIVLPMMIAILLMKWVCIHYLPAAHGRTLFTPFYGGKISLETSLFNWLLYSFVSVPLQTIFVYGGLQGPFMEMTFRYQKGVLLYLPVVAASSFFSVFHLMASVPLAILSGIFCFICGLVYARHGTLIGQIYIHIVIGTWFFFIVGFPFFS